MRLFQKVLAIVLIAVMVLGGLGNSQTQAAETSAMNISVKYVNNKTGIKVSFKKTDGAEAYAICIKGYGDSYLKYLTDSEKDNWRDLVYLKDDGSKTYSGTINGLAKGTYKIKVVALVTDYEFANYSYEGIPYSEVRGSEEKTVKIKAAKLKATGDKVYDFSETKVGDTIVFGSYEQDGIMTNGKEEIEWIVLSKTKSNMLVVSKYALDCIPYNNKNVDITWEKCTLRKWLNSNFYKTAFTKSERKMIKKTKIENADNAQYGIEGGNDTKDRVFILSLDDVTNTKYGFCDDCDEYDMARKCAPTTYAITTGCWSDVATETAEGLYTCYWWVRSPGFVSSNAVVVSSESDVYSSGRGVNWFNFGVRPALYISLE